MTLMRRADGRRDVLGRRHHLVQHAVDAVAHLELVLERLEVDVRGLVLDRLQEHQVDAACGRGWSRRLPSASSRSIDSPRSFESLSVSSLASSLRMSPMLSAAAW